MQSTPCRRNTAPSTRKPALSLLLQCHPNLSYARTRRSSTSSSTQSQAALGAKHARHLISAVTQEHASRSGVHPFNVLTLGKFVHPQHTLCHWRSHHRLPRLGRPLLRCRRRRCIPGTRVSSNSGFWSYSWCFLFVYICWRCSEISSVRHQVWYARQVQRRGAGLVAKAYAAPHCVGRQRGGACGLALRLGIKRSLVHGSRSLRRYRVAAD